LKNHSELPPRALPGSSCHVEPSRAVGGSVSLSTPASASQRILAPLSSS
jgi:hypothetical protein